jgi:hypothetical protein
MILLVPEHIINVVVSTAVLSGSGHVIDHRSVALKGIAPESEMF